MRDPKTGLTHAALVGTCKQSVPDSKKLLFFHVAKCFVEKHYFPKAEYVETIAHWHKASVGRGISQLQHCWQNYCMLNYILDEWIPWHRDHDLSTMDINKYWNIIDIINSLNVIIFGVDWVIICWPSVSSNY